MNRRIFFICSVLLLSVHSISFSNKIPSASIGAQRVIRNGSPVYDALASLAIEAGVVPFATNGPMTAERKSTAGYMMNCMNSFLEVPPAFLI